jgi:hypothetical protein
MVFKMTIPHRFAQKQLALLRLIAGVAALGIGTLGATPVQADSTPAPSPAEAPAATPADVETVATLLEGVMSTVAQSAANPKAANVQMTTCRVQLSPPQSSLSGSSMQGNRISSTSSPSEPKSIFLYQEQALAGNLTQPYRQRFLQIRLSADAKTVESRSYKLKDATEWVNGCTRASDRRNIPQPVSPSLEKSLPTLHPEDLGSPICSVFLTSLGDRRFLGTTPPEGCPTTARGAVRITNTIELSPTGMDTWDRGFDATGKQLWGAKGESYQYRRQ